MDNPNDTRSTPAVDAAGLREAVQRVEALVSLMVPQMPLAWRRANEAAIVRTAHDFADLRAALAQDGEAGRG